MPQDSEETLKSGIAFALGAYLMWGFFPLYWKLLLHIPSFEILAHRMIWSLIFMLAVLGARRQWGWLRSLKPRVVLAYLLAAIFLATNWGMYIWAVNSGHIVETALGYFITPLINVIFGALILKERPRKGQWFAITIAALGVLHLTILYGQVPWIALTLASTFGIYGLIKKTSPLGAIEGVTLESGLLFLPALAFIIYRESQTGLFIHGSPMTIGLLLGSGMATMLPLLCFAAAVRRLSLTVLGVMQYIAPSLQFVIGVLVFNEPMNTTRFVGFVFIWVALALFTAEGLIRRRRLRAI